MYRRRLLLPFRFEGELERSVLDVCNDVAVELLGDGKCFVLAGGHDSGVRYSHCGSRIPTLSLAQLNAYLATVDLCGFSSNPSRLSFQSALTGI
jgi:hypothetical protein